MDNNELFNGVFTFTNASDEEFKALWNNVEYVFPAKSTCKLVIPTETLQNVQEIRKKFAYKYAQREFFKSSKNKEYEKMASTNYLPAGYTEQVFQPYIDQCLSPLPEANLVVKELPKTKLNTKATKAIGDAGVNYLASAEGPFKDDVPESFGKMS